MHQDCARYWGYIDKYIYIYTHTYTESVLSKSSRTNECIVTTLCRSCYKGAEDCMNKSLYKSGIRMTRKSSWRKAYLSFVLKEK